jgi:hypothetical protein
MAVLFLLIGWAAATIAQELTLEEAPAGIMVVAGIAGTFAGACATYLVGGNSGAWMIGACFGSAVAVTGYLLRHRRVRTSSARAPVAARPQSYL